MRNSNRKSPLLVAVAMLASCAQMCPDTPNNDPDPDPEPKLEVDDGVYSSAMGEPMKKATPEQLEAFERGREVALKRFDVDTGLGPNFNVTFCGSCHERPVLGGSAPRYRDFFLVSTILSDGSRVEGGVNGVQAQFNIDKAHPATRNPTDPAINHQALRNAIPFFGVGALAAIDEAAILANVDEDDADGDGISGRPNYDRGFVGRFGRKAQTVSIEGFIRGPLFNHLGVTTVPLSNELKEALPIPSAADQQELEERMGMLGCINCQAAAPSEPNFDEDGVPDPEMSEQELFDLVSFSMLLGAPKPDEPTEQTERGAELFEAIECAKCHVPALAGPDGLVPAYSDLLLHDMGEELADGVEMGLATGSEFRTQPLWGLTATGPYLHDGRASTVEQAIEFHGGEAERSRQAYLDLSPDEKADVLAFLESLGGASQASPGLLPPGRQTPAVGEFGGPTRRLAGAQAEHFRSGEAMFDRDIIQEDGLGLSNGFNGDSCRACHFEPVIGGAGPAGLNVTRQGIIDESSGGFTNSAHGSMLHRHNADRTRPIGDAVCNVIEFRQTPPMFGLGLVDRIPEETILAGADPDDADGDGISGKAHILADGRLARFGWKASIPTLEDFVRDALSNELGLTLADDPQFVAGISSDEDDVADPEFGGKDYDDLVFWSRELGPPPRGEIGAAERAGETLFASVGCDACHTPVMKTEQGEDVALYSDLLLHDVAPADYWGIEDGMASTREFRTPPLWGVRVTAPYMHDGLAPTIEAAILRHDAEGRASREAFEALSESEREELLAFLKSL